MPATGKRRAYGQHFLRDQTIARQIAETAVDLAIEHRCPTLLEVGPGRGAITLPLLEAISQQRAGASSSKDTSTLSRFLLAERDPVLIDFWKSELSKKPSQAPAISLLEGDFLEVPREAFLSQTPLGVASNLPYSAGTAIVVRLAREWEHIPFMVLMFQLEVAERLRAERSTKDWGSLSVWIQNRWNVERLVRVPPGAFSPPPEVQSEVVVLTRKSKPEVEIPPTAQAEADWELLLKLCFAHRRKMLRAGLSGNARAKTALLKSGVAPTLRAEALDWSQWQALFQAFVTP
jgi:16S rRNA (adenine1518-N6/adenine1519-N6)-dimethyltransferase